jgi:hypothetical protein
MMADVKDLVVVEAGQVGLHHHVRGVLVAIEEVHRPADVEQQRRPLEGLLDVGR